MDINTIIKHSWFLETIDLLTHCSSLIDLFWKHIVLLATLYHVPITTIHWPRYIIIYLNYHD